MKQNEFTSCGYKYTRVDKRVAKREFNKGRAILPLLNGIEYDYLDCTVPFDIAVSNMKWNHGAKKSTKVEYYLESEE